MSVQRGIACGEGVINYVEILKNNAFRKDVYKTHSS